MSIEDYRRDLAQRVADAKAARDRARPAGAEAAAGAAAEGSPEARRLSATIADPRAPVPARVAALGQLLAAAGSAEWSIRVALGVLADDAAPPALRLAALQQARLAAIHSPSFPGWRPDYLDALRRAARASDGPLCRSAFEALAPLQDGAAQQMLLEGLERPETARVAPEHALRLLGQDPHAGVHAIARRLADAPPSEAVQLEALRVLASDPTAKERFQALLLDATKALPARMLAATALSSLAPSLLRAASARLADAARTRPPGAESVAAEGPGALAKHVAALLADAP